MTTTKPITGGLLHHATQRPQQPRQNGMAAA